ncbi:MAG: DUF5830 family protein [archaeon]
MSVTEGVDVEPRSRIVDTVDVMPGDAGSPHRDETADYREFVEAIRSINRGESEVHDRLPMEKLVAFGEECETDNYLAKMCPECGDPSVFDERCGRVRCPTCGPWYLATDRAPRIAAKIGAVRAYRSAARMNPQFYHHITISPPDDFLFAADDPFERAIDAIREMAAADDLTGYAFYHPWRIDVDDRDDVIGAIEDDLPDYYVETHDEFDGVEDLVRMAVTAGDDCEYPDWMVGEVQRAIADRDAMDYVTDKLGIYEDDVDVSEEYVDSRAHDDSRGEWKKYLNSGMSWSEVRDNLKYGPHFHIVCAAHKVIGGLDTKRLEEETGWVVHRITKADSSVSIYDDYDLARVVSYCLSHTAVREHPNRDRDQIMFKRFGKNIDDATPTDENLERFKSIVATVAPLTLGIPFGALACTKEREEHEDGECGVLGHDHDHGHDDAGIYDVDPDRSMSGRGSPWPSTGTAGELEDRESTFEHDLPRRSSFGDAVSDAVRRESDLEDSTIDAGLAAVASVGVGGSIADVVDRLEDDVSADPAVQRELLEIAEVQGVIERDDRGGIVVDGDRDRDNRDGREYEQRRCNTRYVSIARAPEFLRDREWVAQADHVAKLAEVYRTYLIRDDYVGGYG